MYSNVHTKTTPISGEDQTIIGRVPFRDTTYFQSLNGFTINRALRDIVGMHGDEVSNLRNVMRGYGMSTGDIESTLNTIRTMDKNMHPLDGDINVVRFVDRPYLQALLNRIGITKQLSDKLPSNEQVDLVKSNLLDTVVTEPGYMSTTYDLSTSLFNARPIRMNLSVAKGTNALFSPISSEAELTISRGSKYKITDVTSNNDCLVINATIGGPE